jgi:hypothetical protein
MSLIEHVLEQKVTGCMKRLDHVKVKLSRYAMQTPRGRGVYLLLILDLGTRWK